MLQVTSALQMAEWRDRFCPRRIGNFAHQRRVKIWGEARVIEGDTELMAKLMPEGRKARSDPGHPLHRFGLGRELPAAHPAAFRGC